MKRNWVLIDFDDTLGGVEVEGEIHPTFKAYTIVIDAFVEEMVGLGFSEEDARAVHYQIDSALCKEKGFGDISRFPQSLVDAYVSLMGSSGKPVKSSKKQKLVNLGMSVFTDYPYVALPGALSSLEMLGQYFNLAVVTKGAKEVQFKKVVDSHVFEFVDRVLVLEKKDVEEWQDTLRSIPIHPPDRMDSWAVGNSVVSDVNPPVHLGINGVHLTGPDEWKFEAGEYIEPVGGIKLRRVQDITEAAQIILEETNNG